ncbi:GDP/GTP exchange factor for ARF [Phlyctochytrium bullatum]|nr:GDP/GTP exchange factor for ARF [Phlyctochytrium bullatum]
MAATDGSSAAAANSLAASAFSVGTLADASVLKPSKPELPWAFVIHSEIVSVTSAMRKNTRWSIQETYGSSMDGVGAGTRGSFDRSRGSPLGYEYNYCLDVVERSFSASSTSKEAVTSSSPIDAVLEFTAVRAGSAGKIGVGLPARSSSTGAEIPFAQAENPLLQGFTQLKARLTLIEDIKDLDPMQVLSPFLDVIRSGDTTGPITGAALTSIEKFINYEVLDPNHPGMPAAMSALTHSVTHCKFEATDAVSDEVVLSKILRLIRTVVTSEVGQKNLDDKGICEMVETGFGMCFQGRVSALMKVYKPLYSEQSGPLKSGEYNNRRTLSRNQSTAAVTPIHAGEDNPPMISVASGHPGSIAEEPAAAMITVGINESLRTADNIAEQNSPMSPQEETHPGIHIQVDGNDGIVVDPVLRSKRSQSFTKAMQGEEIKDQGEVSKQDSPEKTMRSAAAGYEEKDTKPPPAYDDATSRYILPFGLPAILELLRVLVTLIDPRNRNHTDTMHRVVALGLLNVAIEVGGVSLGEWVAWGRYVEQMRKSRRTDDEKFDDESDEDKMAVAARDLVVNELTKYLFQLLQSSIITVNSAPSTSVLTLFSLTLRVVMSLFQTARTHLKLQLEWFLEWIMSKVNAGVVTWDVDDNNNGNQTPQPQTERELPRLQHRDSTSSLGSQNIVGGNMGGRAPIAPEIRELLLEAMVQFFKNPTFPAELWINYDGDLHIQGHLFEEVIRFLSKHSLPDATPGGPVSSVLHQVLCLDSIIMFLRNIISRGAVHSAPESFPLTPTDILNAKHRKRVLKEGADRFNAKPSEGIAFLQANGFLPDPVSPASLATFLKNTPRVSKRLLGEYLAKPANIELLKAFIQLYDFKGKRLDEALRLLLESFRLPGEAQQIDRILECFAAVYFAATQNSPHHEIADESSTFVLAFSIILLNTDQHNPQVRRRMTKEDFKRNTRGCNNKEDFDPEYLGKIYDAIKENEIVMPEEQEGELGFNYTWRELLKRSEQTGLLKIYNGRAFDKDMFLALWNPTLAAISYVEVLDSIIISLAKITGLLKDNGPLPEDAEVKTDEGGSRVPPPARKVDRWSVEFGRSYRGQVAAVLMFNLAVEYGNVLREGWKYVVTIIGNLFLHGILPIGLLTADDFINRHFLSLSSSSSTEDMEDYEPTAEELDAERFTVECITSCRIEELFADSRFMEEDALKFLMATLFSAFILPPSSSVRVGHAMIPPRTSSDPYARSPLVSPAASEANQVTTSSKFSPAAVFYLELLIRIALQNRDRMAVVWPLALEYIKNVLNDPLSKPAPLLDRAVVGLMRLIIRLVHQVKVLWIDQRLTDDEDDMVATVLQSLDLLVGLPSEAFGIVAEQVIAGLLTLIKLDQSILLRHSKWHTVLQLLSATATHPEASKSGFEIATLLVNESADSIVTVENFGECVDLFIGFASAAGSIIATTERSSQSELNTKLGSESSLERNPSRNGSPKVARRSTGGKNAAWNNAIEIAIKALDKLFKLQYKIPRLIQQSGIRQERAWFEFWLPILSGLGQQCYHPSREVRQHALTLLQRALLATELENGTFGVPGFELSPSMVETWVDCFENVIFPLLDELLKPEVYKLDPNGMDETRMRASALLCKIFLQYLQRLLRYRDLPRLWVNILNYMKRYMQASRQEFLNEGILESLKNMLLVMSTQGVFSPNGQSDELKSPHNLWDVTWQHLQDFLPGLKDELFPPHFEEETEAEKPAGTPAAAPTTEAP